MSNISKMSEELQERMHVVWSDAYMAGMAMAQATLADSEKTTKAITRVALDHAKSVVRSYEKIFISESIGG